jgi:hypothetical protein
MMHLIAYFLFHLAVVDISASLEVNIAWQMKASTSTCVTTISVGAVHCSGPSLSKCYRQCFKKACANTSLCYKNNNDGNNYNTCTFYITDHAYTANTYVNNQLNLETYLGCTEYEVTNENDVEIMHYLRLHCAIKDVTVHLGFFQGALRHQLLLQAVLRRPGRHCPTRLFPGRPTKSTTLS